MAPLGGSASTWKDRHCRVQPGKVFNRTVSLAEVPEGYRAMADRTALKILIQP